jgi:hypothetical protein
MAHPAHQVRFPLNKPSHINFFFQTGIAGIQGPQGEAGDGSFIFTRYLIIQIKKLN